MTHLLGTPLDPQKRQELWPSSGYLPGVTLPPLTGKGSSLRMSVAAFSLLGRRAFFVTQRLGAIMFPLPFLCPYRWPYICLRLGLTTWQVLKRIFVSSCLGREDIWPQTLRNWKECWVIAFVQRMEAWTFSFSICVCADLHIHIYSTHTYTLFLKMYIWCTPELHMDALRGSSLYVKRWQYTGQLEQQRKPSPV